jgi:hypothetical protein
MALMAHDHILATWETCGKILFSWLRRRCRRDRVDVARGNSLQRYRPFFFKFEQGNHHYEQTYKRDQGTVIWRVACGVLCITQNLFTIHWKCTFKLGNLFSYNDFRYRYETSYLGHYCFPGWALCSRTFPKKIGILSKVCHLREIWDLLMRPVCIRANINAR